MRSCQHTRDRGAGHGGILGSEALLERRNLSLCRQRTCEAQLEEEGADPSVLEADSRERKSTYAHD